MKKSATSPRKNRALKILSVCPLRQNSTPKNLLGLVKVEEREEENFRLKFKKILPQSCRANKKTMALKSARSSISNTARVSPKSSSTPILFRKNKPNPYEAKQIRPKGLKKVVKNTKTTMKEVKNTNKPCKNHIKEFITQVDLDVYDLPEKFLSNKDIKNKHEEIHKAHLLQTFHGLKLIEKMPKLSFNDIADKMIHLPNIPGLENRKTVVFDLDETLVHCVEDRKGDAEIVITFPTGESLTVMVI